MTETWPISEAFFEALNRDDELGCVVRAHLHIEYLVDKLLAHHFPEPSAIARLHLDYADKVIVLEAFGYLPNLTKPLSAIGSLRNDFAHKLDYGLTKDRMDGLYNTFDSEGKQIIQESYQRTRKNSEESVPRKMGQLSPKDRFAMYAVNIHSMLALGYRKETGRFPD